MRGKKIINTILLAGFYGVLGIAIGAAISSAAEESEEGYWYE